MRAMPKGRVIIRNCSDLKTDDQTYISLCDEVSIYFAPEQETLLEITEGSEILQPIISTGIAAVQSLSAGLYSNSMAMGKGVLIDADKKVMELPTVKEWYSILSTDTQHHISQSRFPEAFEKFTSDFVPFGGGVMYLQWNPDTLKHEYKVFPIGKCHYRFDSNDDLSEMYREYQYTAAQAVDKFGYDACPKVVRKAYDDEDVKTKYDFVHCMRPNKKYDANSTHWSKMKFESLHVHFGTGKICKESGSKRMRYIVEHFYHKNGERNGRSPAMQALPVLRTLMKVVSDHIDGTELAIGPPMWLPDRNAVEHAVLEAFGVNYCDMSKGQPWLFKNDQGALRISSELIDFLKKEIDTLFMVDLFKALEMEKSGQRTAYEVSQLVAERMQMIAPVANSLGNFFRRVYYLTAMDLVESGQVMAPPTALNLEEARATYTSRLDVRLNEIENTAMMEAVMQAVELVTAMSEMPVVRAVVKEIDAVIAIFESHNVDPDIVRNKDDAEEKLAEIMEEMAQAVQAERMASAVKPVDTQKAPEAGSPADMIEQGAGNVISQ